MELELGGGPRGSIGVSPIHGGAGSPHSIRPEVGVLRVEHIACTRKRLSQESAGPLKIQRRLIEDLVSRAMKRIEDDDDVSVQSATAEATTETTTKGVSKAKCGRLQVRIWIPHMKKQKTFGIFGSDGDERQRAIKEANRVFEEIRPGIRLLTAQGFYMPPPLVLNEHLESAAAATPPSPPPPPRACPTGGGGRFIHFGARGSRAIETDLDRDPNWPNLPEAPDPPVPPPKTDPLLPRESRVSTQIGGKFNLSSPL